MEKTTKGKSMNRALLMGTALISLNALAAAQAQAATGTGAMSAEVLAPITVTSAAVLHFGSITVASTGTTGVGEDGTRAAATGGVTNVVGAGNEAAGVLNINSAGGIALNISMAAATYTVDDTGAGVAMNVSSFRVAEGDNLPNVATGTNVLAITAPAATESIAIGATLTTGATQVAGTYTGNYTINANYQ